MNTIGPVLVNSTRLVRHYTISYVSDIHEEDVLEELGHRVLQRVESPFVGEVAGDNSEERRRDDDP